MSDKLLQSDGGYVLLEQGGALLLAYGPDGLVHSPAEVIQRLLIVDTVGAEPGSTTQWTAWSTNEHDTPDDGITVYDTVGSDDGRVMYLGQPQSHWGIMIRIRSQSHAVGFVKANEVREYLTGSVRNRLVTIPTSGDRTGASYLVHAVTKIGQVMYLGSDVPNSRRKLFTINATVALRRTA